MKIIYLCFDINKIAGGNRVIIEHANGLAQRGHQVEIWSNEKPSEIPFACFVPLHHFNGSNLPGYSDVIMITEVGFAIYIIQKKIAAQKYFFLAQHDIELVSELNGMWAFKDMVKNFFSNPPFQFEVISVSSWIQEQLLKRYGLKSTLALNGVDTRLFFPAQPMVQVAEPIIALYFDNQNWKGFYDACVAISIVKQRVKKCTVLVIGAMFPQINTIINGSVKEISSFSWPVIFLNRPEQEKLAAIYSSATVFVSSSWYEGFGLPGLEAMACGVPVVTTDSGGVRDYTISDETAIIVPPRDSRALANAILRVLDDKNLRDKLVDGGLKITKKLNWTATIDSIENIMEVAIIN